jgi:hypothetical protein
MTGATNPWRLLRSRPHITLRWTRLRHRYGETDGHSLIRLHPDQLQVERRVSVLHELIHIERGHTRRCDGAEERAVRREVARRLIPIDALLRILVWTDSWHEAADELWVTVDVFQDRLDGLTDDERARIIALSEEIDHGA